VARLEEGARLGGARAANEGCAIQCKCEGTRQVLPPRLTWTRRGVTGGKHDNLPVEGVGRLHTANAYNILREGWRQSMHSNQESSNRIYYTTFILHSYCDSTYSTQHSKPSLASSPLVAQLHSQRIFALSLKVGQPPLAGVSGTLTIAAHCHALGSRI